MLERQREILFKDFDRYEHEYTDTKQHYLFYLTENLMLMKDPSGRDTSKNTEAR